MKLSLLGKQLRQLFENGFCTNIMTLAELVFKDSIAEISNNLITLIFLCHIKVQLMRPATILISLIFLCHIIKSVSIWKTCRTRFKVGDRCVDSIPKVCLFGFHAAAFRKSVWRGLVVCLKSMLTLRSSSSIMSV